jgi:hypothetical protein
MVLCTLCPLIIPFLALSGVNGIHPVREPISSVGLVVMTSAESGGSMRVLPTCSAVNGRSPQFDSQAVDTAHGPPSDRVA